MGSSSVAEDSLRTLCPNTERVAVPMWKLEWFRYGRGKGRHAERIEGEYRKGALMIMQETTEAHVTVRTEDEGDDPEDTF